MSTSLVLFDGADSNGLFGLWETDGTAAGTWEISVPGFPPPGFSGPVSLDPFDITAFDHEAIFGRGLWVTDGTSPGTSELSFPGGQNLSDATGFASLGSEALFSGLTNNGSLDFGLWVTDGTDTGTSEITVNGANPLIGLDPHQITAFGSEALFYGSDSHFQEGLWITDGTSAGTSELTVAGASANGLFPFFPSGTSNFALLGSEALFAGTDTASHPGLWKTDGTSGGTSEITTATAPTELVTFGTEVLFAGQDGGLWVTDGTAAGTSEIKQNLGAPQDLTVFGNKVLFAAGTANDRELWVTDGTSGGTSQIAVAGAGPDGPFIDYITPFLNNGPFSPGFVVLGSEVLFEAQAANLSLGLWVTDGTSAGTSELSVAGSFPSGLSPTSLAAFNQDLIEPVLSNVPASDSYTERAAPVTLAPALHVSDDNNSTLVSATVAITGGTFANDGDVLAFSTAGTSITAAYDSTTETLTLAGVDTLADYQAVLQTITFANPSHDPTNSGSDPVRIITWVANDGAASNQLSAPQTTTLSIAAINEPPTLSNVAGTAQFTEEGGAVTLSNAITITDIDDADLSGATVSVTGAAFLGIGQDVLAANTAGTSITASYNPFNDTLTLSGTDTLAHYRQVLDSITFNSGENPNNYGFNPTRLVKWVVTDPSGTQNGGSNVSSIATTTLSVANVNDPPTLSHVATTLAVVGSHPVKISPTISVADPDSLTVSSATVAVTGGTFAGDGDVLAATTTNTSITASYNSSTETLTLSGADDVFKYAAVLGSVTFSAGPNQTNLGSNPTRTLTWVLNDGSASNSLSTPATTTISITPQVRNDLNADAKSDLLLQNTNGTPQVWLMNGASATSMTSLINPGPSWHLAATGDFNLDGTADLLWQNNDGLPSIWEMNGTSIIGGGLLPNPGPSWHVIATGDFNSDGAADILWQNTDGAAAIWEMNGTSIIGGGVLINPGSSWHVIGAGDFNGDGKADILWQNTDGTPAIWEMNGTAIIGGGVLPNPGPSWHAIGTGDFNGDGKADILWQNSDGRPSIWELNGTSFVGGGALPNPGASWHAIGTSDFNGDGKADIIWQNSDGMPAIWEMNGTAIIGGGVLPNPGAGWQVKDDGPIPADQMTVAPANTALPANGAQHLSAPDSFAGGAASLGDPAAWKLSGNFLPFAAPQMFRT